MYREKKYGIMNAIRPADDPGGDGREVYSMARIVEVTDLTAPGPDVFAGLTEGQLRSRRDAELGLFIAESPKVIVRALDAGYEPISLLMEPRQIEGQGRGILERCPDVPVYTAQREVLANLTGSPAAGSGEAGHCAGDGRRRIIRRDHCPVRLYGADSHGPGCGLTECGGGQRCGVLGAAGPVSVDRRRGGGV